MIIKENNRIDINKIMKSLKKIKTISPSFKYKKGIILEK